MISHFGINPVNGGSPPRDMRVIRIIMVISGVLFDVRDSEFMVVVRLVINSMNMVVVIGIYR